MSSYKELEIVQNAKIGAKKLEERVIGGRVIKDFINDEGERILVTETIDGKYGYAVYKKNENSPHYIVEVDILLQDLNKKTAHNGVALRYPGAKSMIQRNMVGFFVEYIKDPGFESMYFSVQMPKNATINVSQQMSGYYGEDAVSIFSVDFRREKINYASYAQMLPGFDGKPTIRIGMVGLNSDGMPDHETTIKIANDAELAKKFLGMSSMKSELVEEITVRSAEAAQSLFFEQ